jgi:hypothetical protein
VGDDVLINSDALLMINFMNLKIKSAQFFRCVHMNRVYVHVFIKMSVHICISMYIYTIFLKKKIYSNMQEPRLDGHALLT